MQKLIFTLRYLLKGRGNNAIKLISLSLGLAVGILLLAYSAFEKSYNRCYPDSDRIYRVEMDWTLQGDPRGKGNTIWGPIVPTFVDELPEVEAGTRTRNLGRMNFESGENLYPLETIAADTTLFNLFGIPVLLGNPGDLPKGNNIAISDKLARTIFGSKNPIGQPLLYNRTKPYYVVAVFKEIPLNSSLQYDAVLPITNAQASGVYVGGWVEGDNMQGYIRLKKGSDPQAVTAKIPELQKRHYDVDAVKKEGLEVRILLNPFENIHIEDGRLSQTLFVVLLLALLILFVAGMNYVLISISSLATRARTIAVHRCNGASTWDIFSMFMQETAVLMIVALAIALTLIAGLEKLIAEQTIARFPIFTAETLRPAGIAIAALFLISSLIPAILFSRISPTQAFHRYLSGKKHWKQTLLFIQFTASALMLGLLSTTVRQYSSIVNHDIGYKFDKIVYLNTRDIPAEQVQTIRNELEGMPEVEMVATGAPLFEEEMDGVPVYDKITGEMLVSTRAIDNIDKNYIPLMNIRLKHGSNFTDDSPANAIIVNEELIKQLHLNENPVGEMLNISYNQFFDAQQGAVVAGVAEDFRVASLYTPQQPMILVHKKLFCDYLLIRLTDLNPDNIEAVNRKIAAVVGNSDLSVNDYEATVMSWYSDAMRFRNSIMSVAFITLAITFIGLIGYISDEVRRRSKEIAIRKINGATAADVIRLIGRDTAAISLPGVVIGLSAAYYLSQLWLEQFPDKMSLGIWIFVLCGLIILSFTAAALYFKTNKTANENPVKAIKTE